MNSRTLDVAARLRNGQQYITSQESRTDLSDGDLAALVSNYDKWEGLEAEARADGGLVGCIHEGDQRCPSDAPIRCWSCAGPNRRKQPSDDGARQDSLFQMGRSH